ncbi:MAG: hypothetical protein ACRDRH_26075 [Pseudonocardia sp.]
MTWMISHRSGSSTAMISSSMPRSSGPIPFDAGVQVVSGRVAGVGCVVDDVQGVGAADAVLARRSGELDVLHLLIVSDILCRTQVASGAAGPVVPVIGEC